MKLYPHQIENISLLQHCEAMRVCTRGYFVDGAGTGKSVCILELISRDVGSKSVIYCQTAHLKQWWKLYVNEYNRERILFIACEQDLDKMSNFNTHIVPDSMRSKHFHRTNIVYDRCVNDTSDTSFVAAADFMWWVVREKPDSWYDTYIVELTEPYVFDVRIIERDEPEPEHQIKNVKYRDQIALCCFELQTIDDPGEHVFDRLRELKKQKREWCENFEREAHGSCFICCEDMSRMSVYLACCHNFACFTCMTKVSACPFCREQKPHARVVHLDRSDRLRETFAENNYGGRSLVIGGEQGNFQTLDSVGDGHIWIPASTSLDGYDLGFIDRVYRFEPYSMRAIIGACIRLGRTKPLRIFHHA